MGVVFVGFIFFCASALIKNYKRAKAQREMQRIAYEKELARIAKEQSRHAKEIAKHEAMLKKHEEEIEKCKSSIKQAEADILAEQKRLDHYTAKLSALDDEIAKVNRDIEYYQLANKVDAENEARAAKVKLEDKIFSFEEKVRACEKRMDKAINAKNTAERKLSA